MDDFEESGGLDLVAAELLHDARSKIVGARLVAILADINYETASAVCEVKYSFDDLNIEAITCRACLRSILLSVVQRGFVMQLIQRIGPDCPDAALPAMQASRILLVHPSVQTECNKVSSFLSGLKRLT